MLLNQQTIEPIVRLIPGVQTVRVQLSNSVLEEIHILSTPDRPAQHIVADVERVFLEQFNIAIDRRIVSVAQLEVQEQSSRIVLDSVQLTWRDEMTEAKVELIINGERYTGSSVGPSSQKHRIRTVAKATTDALSKVLPNNIHTYVDEVGQVHVGDNEAVVVTLGIHEGVSEQIVVGCAYIRRDDAESAARAVLSALNRKFSRWENYEKNS